MNAQDNRELELSPTELEIMKVVWRMGRATARQLCDDLAERVTEQGQEALKFSTISTYLERLRLKGVLDREEVGHRSFEYFALTSREEVQKRMLRRLEGLFDTGEDFLHQFANTAKLGRRERQELRRIAKKLRDDRK